MSEAPLREEKEYAPINWSVTAVLGLTFIVAVTIVPWYGIVHGYSGWAWLFFGIFVAVIGACVLAMFGLGGGIIGAVIAGLIGIMGVLALVYGTSDVLYGDVDSPVAQHSRCHQQAQAPQL